jgi:hypothetical protein
LIADPAQSGVKSKLTALRTEVGRSGPSDTLKSLLSDSTVVSVLKSIKAPQLARQLNDSLAPIRSSSMTTRPLVLGSTIC